MSAREQKDPEAIGGTPATTFDLLGHEEAESDLAAALSFGRVHHAWLITGPKGVGKATLAFRAARILLGAKRQPGARPLAANPEDPVAQSIAKETHPDLRVLRRSVDEKTGKLRSEISVDEARGLSAFFSLSAGAGGQRIAIIDAADDLNRNAANALLKTIEEPPPRCVLFLVCNAPGAIPRTILSRCRRLSLRTPNITEVTAWLERQGFSLEDALVATRLARSAPGLAMTFARGSGPDRYKTFSNCMQLVGSSRGSLAAQGLIDAAAAKPSPGELSTLDLLFAFSRDWLSRAGRLLAGLDADEIIPDENTATKKLITNWSSVRIAEAYAGISELQEQSDALNFDRAHTAVELFSILSKLAPARR